MEIRAIKRDSRAIELSIPIKVAARLATPSELLYRLTQEDAGLVTLTSQGELTFPKFELTDETKSSEGTVNYDLLAQEAVANKLVFQESGFLFPAFEEETLDFPVRALINRTDTEKGRKFKVRTIEAKTLMGALTACMPNMDPSYCGRGNSEVGIANWRTMLDQVNSVIERLGKTYLIKEHSSDDQLEIVAELDGAQQYKRGISFSGIRFTTGSLGLQDSDYPLHIDVRSDINPGWVADSSCQSGALENFLTPIQIQTIEDVSQAKARKIAKHEREKVSAYYDEKEGVFVIKRDNCSGQASVGGVPTSEIISTHEIIRDYVIQAIQVGYEDYKQQRALRQEERTIRLARLEEELAKRQP